MEYNIKSLDIKNFKQMVVPRRFYVEELTSTYGKFYIEPFELGFGTTLGNAFRRVLLSYIKGAAIDYIRINNIYHEFSSIPGMYEDVEEFILNLKGLTFKINDNEEHIIRLNATGPGEITGADLKVDDPTGIEIRNPEQYICTLQEKSELDVEIKVVLGRSYVSLEEKQTDEIGVILVDSIFSPIKNATFLVTPARIGQKTHFDRLTLEIETNGTIAPDEALIYAAQIIKDHVSIFLEFSEEEEIYEPLDLSDLKEKVTNLQKNVEELDLSVRAKNCLKTANIRTIKDLVSKTEAELLSFKNFGKKSLEEIKEAIVDYNLFLGMEPNKLEEELREKERQQLKMLKKRSNYRLLY